MLLEVNDLRTSFDTAAGEVRAVDGVSFSLDAGRTLGLVGESGCGKSVTALSIVRLVAPPGRLTGGEVWFAGRNLATLDVDELRRLRGTEIAMIFQDPMTSLNPVFTVGDQIAEAMRVHLGLDRRAAWSRAIELMELVAIPDAARRARAYPHEMSGGMRQRVMIAAALACSPRLLIADEPTTALDVTIQAQILDLLKRLQRELNLALLLITHDLGVVAEVCDDVAVMYAGRLVESGPVSRIFKSASHPYTAGLLRSVPRLRATAGAQSRLHTIEGVVPRLIDLPEGCRFAPRCPYRIELCTQSAGVLPAPPIVPSCHRAIVPSPVSLTPNHQVWCTLYDDSRTDGLALAARKLGRLPEEVATS
jgi:oligopeptide/dipeptide ABC transporter ATP-binding protein